MIKIIAVLTLWVMCYFVAKKITIVSVPSEDYFMWGWMASITTGLLINWFVKAIE